MNDQRKNESLKRIARIGIVLLLVGVIFYMDETHMRIGPVTAEKIYETLAVDYENMMREFLTSTKEAD